MTTLALYFEVVNQVQTTKPILIRTVMVSLVL